MHFSSCSLLHSDFQLFIFNSGRYVTFAFKPHVGKMRKNQGIQFDFIIITVFCNSYARFTQNGAAFWTKVTAF